MRKKKIVILGITGSIGESSCNVIRENTDLFDIVLASAHKNQSKLTELTQEFSIPNTILTSLDDEDNLIKLLEDLDYDIVINAITGSAGLKSSYTVLKRGKKLALANKESLVMAGHILQKYTLNNPILPVDSEHSAIFQCLGSHQKHEVDKLIITASGGSFRDRPLHTFKDITIAETLKHPNWDMGAKVTIDSATMMNKGLEVIEAHWLFNMPFEQIQAIIHPQSIIHSMVKFVDGSHIAQMSSPSMQLPILYALSHPQHIPYQQVKTDLLTMPDLTFRAIDKDRYPLFFLALEVGLEGGIFPTIMNSANEACISLFLDKKIRFKDFYAIISEHLLSSNQINNPNLETIININESTFKEIVGRY